MEVLVLKAFMANGKPQPPGTVLDLPVADAHYAIGLKRAERIEPVAVDAGKAAETDAAPVRAATKPRRSSGYVPPYPNPPPPAKDDS